MRVCFIQYVLCGVKREGEGDRYGIFKKWKREKKEQEGTTMQCNATNNMREEGKKFRKNDV